MSDIEQPSRRFRFSLLNLVLLMTIVAMAIGLWQLYAELAPLRAENRRLRDEVGEISITDPTKLHAIQVEAGDDFTWKWRVWVPAGQRYKLRSEGGEGEVPKQGFPEHGGTMYLEVRGDTGEEFWVSYVIKKNDESGRWFGSMKTRTGSVGADQHPWVDRPGRVSTNDGVGNSTRVVEPGETLVLARWRTANAASTADIPDPADGFMVWIEPQ